MIIFFEELFIAFIFSNLLALCYGLNVYPLNSYVENLMSEGMVLGEGVFRR